MANTSYCVLKEFHDFRYQRQFYPGQIWVADPALNSEVADRTADGQIGAVALATPTPPAATVPYPRGF